MKDVSVQQPLLIDRCPFLCHPEAYRISYFTALTGPAYVVLLKENHMQLVEAAALDMKSGEADLSRLAVEGSAVRHSGAPHLPLYNRSPLCLPTCPGVPWEQGSL
jgi:hypothetical protein